MLCDEEKSEGMAPRISYKCNVNVIYMTPKLVPSQLLAIIVLIDYYLGDWIIWRAVGGVVAIATTVR